MSASESNATSPTSDQSEYIYNGDELGFASTTECHYVEYLQYPDSTDVQVAEGSLDDSTLPTWLQKVSWYRMLLESLITEMERTLIFLLLQREVDKTSLVAYVYCEPSLCFCCHIEKLTFISGA
jgi:hypothetical protein